MPAKVPPTGQARAAGTRHRRTKTPITERLLTRRPRRGTAKPTPATGYRAGNGRDPRASAPARPHRRQQPAANRLTNRQADPR